MAGMWRRADHQSVNAQFYCSGMSVWHSFGLGRSLTENEMSIELWSRLPAGLLKRSFSSWKNFDYEVKSLIVELAEKQKFKCIHCGRAKGLVIEHDHDPEFGTGKDYTIYNIRGLTCQRCNWHLMLYEKDAAFEERSWNNADSRITDSEYGKYIYEYQIRSAPLIQKALEQKLGKANYWHRSNFLFKFDDWREFGRNSSWGSTFESRTKRPTIREFKQFIFTLAECVKFVAAEQERNPDYVPPDKFLQLLIKVKPIVNEALKLSDSQKA